MYNAAFLKLAYLLHMLNMMALLNMQNYDDVSFHSPSSAIK